MPRTRRFFPAEFKADAVRHARDSGKTVGQVAKDLDPTETSLRKWMAQAEVDAGRGPVLLAPR